MRELKFRSWNNERYIYAPNRFVYTDDYDKEDVDDYESIGHFFATRDNIEQYTGLKDKNGKEIYEGDIVVPVSDLGHRYMEDRGVVKFGAVESFEDDIEYQCWHSEGKYNGVLEDRPKGYEVIGNIHENPELLKGEE